MLQRPANRSSTPHGPFWSFKAGQQARHWGLLGHHTFSYLERSNGQLSTHHSKRLHKATDLLWKNRRPKPFAPVESNPSLAGGNTEYQTFLKRSKRDLRAVEKPNTVEDEVIMWGSTLEPLETSTMPRIYDISTTFIFRGRTSTMTTTMTATTTTAVTTTTLPPEGLIPGTAIHNNTRRVSTMEPPSTSDGNGKVVAPPKKPGESSGIYTCTCFPHTFWGVSM